MQSPLAGRQKTTCLPFACEHAFNFPYLMAVRILQSPLIRFGRPAGEKRVYLILRKKPTGAANLKV
jgi:hypothetical protein